MKFDFSQAVGRRYQRWSTVDKNGGGSTETMVVIWLVKPHPPANSDVALLLDESRLEQDDEFASLFPLDCCKTFHVIMRFIWCVCYQLADTLLF